MEEAVAADNANVKVRLLICLNNKNSLRAVIPYLTRRDYELSFSNKLSEAVLLLKTFKPHVIFVSWNLKDTDVPKVHKLLTQKFEIPCIVFAEENNVRTSRGLSRSGIPNALPSPVSGSSMHVRIQGILAKKHNDLQSDGKGKKKANTKMVEADQDDMITLHGKIAPDTPWAQSTKKDGDDDMWEASIKEEDGSSRSYYFRGKQPPIYDAKKRMWVNANGKAIKLYAEEVSLDDSELQEALKESEKKLNLLPDKMDEGFELNESAKYDDNSFSESEEGEEKVDSGAYTATVKKVAKKSVKMEDIITVAMRQSVIKPVPVEPEHFLLYKNRREMFIAFVQTARFKGYWIAMLDGTPEQKAKTEEFLEIFTKEMNAMGEPMKTEPLKLVTKISELDFNLLQKGHERLMATIDEVKIFVLGFDHVEDFPEVLEIEEHKMLGFEFKGNIVLEETVPFDIFIHMPLNGKFIRYVNKDQPLNPQAYQRFKNAGIRRLYIRSEDREEFLKYCALNHILAKLKK